MSRPKLLDVCCGAGLGAVGYDRAGWDVYGVDNAPQPNYPFAFHQGDALKLLAGLYVGQSASFVRRDGTTITISLNDFAAIHASWPCQAANPLTTGTNRGKYHHPQLIPAGRELMSLTGLPWIIENTAGAPIRKDLRLVGDMFTNADGSYALSVWRPRYFELSGCTVPQPPMPKSRGRTRGWRHGTYYDGPYLAVYGDGGGKGTVAEWQAAMGVTHTDVRKEIAEGIPPAYGEYLGRHLLGAIEHEALGRVA